MHGAQRRIPHCSQLSQQLCAVDSVPFASEGRLTLSVLLSSCFPLHWKWCRQRMQPGASAERGEAEHSGAWLGGWR